MRNAAAKAKPTAIVKTTSKPANDPAAAVNAKSKPTVCANCGGRTSSVSPDFFNLGFTRVLNINAYGRVYTDRYISTTKNKKKLKLS